MKTYSIIFNRKEQKPVEEEKREKSNNKSNINIYVIGGTLIVAIAVFIILNIKKHRKISD